jgi:hypothetical protein
MGRGRVCVAAAPRGWRVMVRVGEEGMWARGGGAGIVFGGRMCVIR